MIFKPWTSRNVQFELYPRQDNLFEGFADALVEHYWGRPLWVRRFLEPNIGSCNDVMEIAGFPWWMPKWWARRTVVNIAHQAGVSGSATFVVERTSLITKEDA